jgi:hypothetical protein
MQEIHAVQNEQFHASAPCGMDAGGGGIKMTPICHQRIAKPVRTANVLKG